MYSRVKKKIQEDRQRLNNAIVALKVKMAKGDKTVKRFKVALEQLREIGYRLILALDEVEIKGQRIQGHLVANRYNKCVNKVLSV